MTENICNICVLTSQDEADRRVTARVATETGNDVEFLHGARPQTETWAESSEEGVGGGVSLAWMSPGVNPPSLCNTTTLTRGGQRPFEGSEPLGDLR